MHFLLQTSTARKVPAALPSRDPPGWIPIGRLPCPPLDKGVLDACQDFVKAPIAAHDGVGWLHTKSRPKGAIMERQHVDPFEHANTITQANPGGILLTTKAGGEVNTMVIGWGLIGTLWGKPTFTAFVRTSRHTHALLEENPEFTVNVSLEGERLNRDIFAVAGTKSGRSVDKVAELGLTLVDGSTVDVPAIAEVPLTLECKVMYQQLMDKGSVPEDIQGRFYPADVTDIDKGGNCYYHVIYYGEIVDSYIVR